MNRRDEFYQEVAQKWLSGLLPEVIKRGGDERDVLAILEYLVAGTLVVTAETFDIDATRAFERIKLAVDQRLADFEGSRGRIILEHET